MFKAFLFGMYIYKYIYISFLFQWLCHCGICSKLLWNLFIPRSVKRVRPETFNQKYHPPEHPRFSHGSPSPAFPSKAQTIHFTKITKLHLSKAGKKGPCKHGCWWWWKLQLARLSFPDLNYIWTTVLDSVLGAGNPVTLRTIFKSLRGKVQKPQSRPHPCVPPKVASPPRKKTKSPRGVEILTKSMLLEKDSILKSRDFWCRAVFRGSTFSPNKSKDHPKTRSCYPFYHFIWPFGSSSSINKHQKAGRQLSHESFRLPNRYLDGIAARCHFFQAWFYTVF